MKTFAFEHYNCRHYCSAIKPGQFFIDITTVVNLGDFCVRHETRCAFAISGPNNAFEEEGTNRIRKVRSRSKRETTGHASRPPSDQRDTTVSCVLRRARGSPTCLAVGGGRALRDQWRATALVGCSRPRGSSRRTLTCVTPSAPGDIRTAEPNKDAPKWL